MCDAEFHYTYEYQGNAAKLVHTPLTDKCYLTLTQGMHMGLGGNPYGPAGTGKTESVKALGGLFGRQVLVFNCDEVRMKTYLPSDIKVDLEYRSVKSHIRDFALSFPTTITSVFEFNLWANISNISETFRRQIRLELGEMLVTFLDIETRGVN